MVGVICLLIIDSIRDLSAASTPEGGIGRYSLFKDLLFLSVAAIIVYFSVGFYKKIHFGTELNYQQLFNGSPLPMYVMTKDTLQFLAVNDAMVKLYGFTEAEFLRMTAFDIRPSEERGRVKAFLDEFGELTNDSGRWLHQKKNGDCFFVQITFHYIPLIEKGAYLVMITDIDKSINDEKKISDLLHLYETVNRATNDVIWDYNIVTDELTWMQGYFETYGYTKESSANSFWAMQKIHPDDRDYVQEEFKRVLDHKRKDWSAEYRYICADGTVKYIRDRGYVIFSPAGEPVRMIGALQDIDKQKKFEQQLLSQNEQLKEIAWIHSHQVRRPLSNILGLIALIKGSEVENEELRQLIDLLAVSSRELDDAVILINREAMEGTA
ncbi:PAS domain S-box-containing protein [Pedobacter westerhofensis]|uniref:histidine kinase n=1 Tax=Pedobacter westerhofensis TaxID=425512 RepID=A0A521F151_9SPHI|nr:PAS domain S-box-containing protein [Pedobacter westerhofensis]